MRRTHRTTPLALALAIGFLLTISAVGVLTHDPTTAASAAPPSAGRLIERASEKPAPSDAAPPAPENSKPATTRRASGVPAASPATTSPTPPNTFPLMQKGYVYEVVLTPACARPGEPFTATLKLKPKWGSTGTVMPFYADGSHEEGAGQIAEPDGTVTYSWIARPIPGEGRLVTQGQDADTGEFGSKVVAFRVVEAGQSC